MPKCDITWFTLLFLPARFPLFLSCLIASFLVTWHIHLSDIFLLLFLFFFFVLVGVCSQHLASIDKIDLISVYLRFPLCKPFIYSLDTPNYRNPLPLDWHYKSYSLSTGWKVRIKKTCMAFCSRIGSLIRQGRCSDFASVPVPLNSLLNAIRCMSSSKLFIGGMLLFLVLYFR